MGLIRQEKIVENPVTLSLYLGWSYKIPALTKPTEFKYYKINLGLVSLEILQKWNLKKLIGFNYSIVQGRATFFHIFQTHRIQLYTVPYHHRIINNRIENYVANIVFISK